MFRNIATTLFYFSLFICIVQSLFSNNQTAFLINDNNIKQNQGQIIFDFSLLTPEELFDTATYYYERNSTDTALLCYSLLVNASIAENDTVKQRMIVDALYKSAYFYYSMSDYRNAYASLIEGLSLCEKYDFKSEEWKIYANLGVIYVRFKKLDMAEQYYSKALQICKETENEADGKYAGILNNLGVIYLENGEYATAFEYINRSLQIFKERNDPYLCSILKSIAIFYQKTEVLDSALHYFRLSLNESKKNNAIDEQVDNLSGMGNVFFNNGKIDSAVYYINLSNIIAKDNKFLDILAYNYLTLSKIEETKGESKAALEYYKNYATLNDSILNTKIFGDINQIQHQHDFSKTSRQIEQFAVEKQIREGIIRYQNIILFIVIAVLFVVSGMLLFVILQKNKLNKAHKMLVEKNVKIIEFQENLPEQTFEKYRKSTITDNTQHELWNKILTLMKNHAIICDTEFSLDKLTALVQSNHAYVSQVINIMSNKNFRSFLNSYRIEDAQRLLTKLDTSKYTIESVAFQVGFKSSNTFRTAFKENTGVSPAFYLKSLHNETSQ